MAGKWAEVVVGDVICFGIDLAWSRRNLTGGAVIVDGCLVDARGDLGDDDALIAWVSKWLSPGDAAVIAIDAPLRVPNELGGRACERELAAQWRRYDAGPYYANRKNLAVDGVVRGEALVAALNRHFGFVEAAPIVSVANGRFVCEVFPHPSHVSLFGLDRILKYKLKHPGQYESAWLELMRYQQLLRGLQNADPPLVGVEKFLHDSENGLRGKPLKVLEDMLDAVTCAYVASYLWRHGAGGAWVYGDIAEGHIVVPRFPPAP